MRPIFQSLIIILSLLNQHCTIKNDQITESPLTVQCVMLQCPIKPDSNVLTTYLEAIARVLLKKKRLVEDNKRLL